MLNMLLLKEINQLLSLIVWKAHPSWELIQQVKIKEMNYNQLKKELRDYKVNIIEDYQQLVDHVLG